MKEKTLVKCLEYVGIKELGKVINQSEMDDKAIALVKKNEDECYIVVRKDDLSKGYAVLFDPAMEYGLINTLVELYSIKEDKKEEPKAPIKVDVKVESKVEPKVVNNDKAGAKQQRGSKGKGNA